VGDGEREEVGEALGLADAQQEAGPAAPVVADELDAIEAERVEDGEDVGGEVLFVVAEPGRVGPAEAAQVQRDDAVVGGQGWDDVAPQVVMLRPAVQEEDWVAVRWPGLGVVKAQAAGLDVAVGYPRDFGRSGQVRELPALERFSRAQAR
jgi:hypothetical protein